MSTAQDDIEIHTVEMHTGGEPLRIITNGFPTIPGKTILEKRRYVKTHFDHFRTLLMHEPRGHFDMYGALLVPPDHPEADIGVLFLHNEGYSSMCGHAVIALARYVVDNNYSVKPDANVRARRQYDVIEVAIQCPCGLVRAHAKMEGDKCKEVSFVSVPAFSFANDITIKTKEFGDVVLDIGYGGAFYALVEDRKLNISLESSSYEETVNAATVVSQAVKQQVQVQHPEEEDLSFLYGTILTDGKDAYDGDKATMNLCVFADRQVDRCPTGSGVTARVAVQFAKGLISIGERRTFINSVVKSQFDGKPVLKAKCGSHDAVQVEVTGQAYYTGRSVFTVEKDDPLRYGFLVK